MAGKKLNEIDIIPSVDISSVDSVLIVDQESQQTRRATLEQVAYFFNGSGYTLSPSSISSFATTTIIAGNGLTGGGTTGAVTLHVGAGSGISVSATQVSVDSTVVRTTGTNTVTVNTLNATTISASNYVGPPIGPSTITIGTSEFSLGSTGTSIENLDVLTVGKPFVTKEFTVTNNESSEYLFSDGDSLDETPNPSISMVVGDTLIFNVSSSGHPFWIKTSPVTGSISGSTEATGNGTEEGTVTFVPTEEGTFYYICENHSVMSGTIEVTVPLIVDIREGVVSAIAVSASVVSASSYIGLPTSSDTITIGTSEFSLGSTGTSIENLTSLTVGQPGTKQFTVINNESSEYLFSDGDNLNEAANPSISMVVGDTLIFNVNSPGHPFWIKTSPVIGTVSGSTEATGNGTEEGTVTFTPTEEGTFYYICQNHLVMFGEITVVAALKVEGAVSATKVAASVVSASSYIGLPGSSGIITIGTSEFSLGSVGTSIENLDLLTVGQPFVTKEFTVTSNEFLQFLFSDGDSLDETPNPSISMVVGDTLVFNVSSPGHPFWIKTSPVEGTVSGSTEATGNGTEEGTVTFVPTEEGTFYYVCEDHLAMFGEIIVDLPIVLDTRGAASFASVSTSVISASQYIGLPPADVTATGNNTFTGTNTFNANFITASVGITGSVAQFTTISASFVEVSQKAEIKDDISTDKNILNVGIDRALLPSDLDTYWHDYAKINFASVNETGRTTALAVMQQAETDIYGTLAVASYTAGSTDSGTNNTGIWSDVRHLGNSPLSRLRGNVSFPIVDGPSTVNSAFLYYGYTEVNGGGTIIYNYGLNINSPDVISGMINQNYAIYVDDQDSANTGTNYAIYVEADNKLGFYSPFLVLSDGRVAVGGITFPRTALNVTQQSNNSDNHRGAIIRSDDYNNGSQKSLHQSIIGEGEKHGTADINIASTYFGFYQAKDGSSGQINYLYLNNCRVEDEVGANVVFDEIISYFADAPQLYGNSTINNLYGIYIDSMTQGLVSNYLIYGRTGTPSYNFQVTGDGHVGIGSDPGSDALYVNGSQFSTTTATFNVVSDERTKTNIQIYEKGLNEINQLEPVSFTYNGLGKTTSGYSSVGLIAQQVEQIIPEMVKKREDFLSPEDSEKTELLSLDNHPLMFVMVNAIKELSAKVEQLQQEIEILKNK